VPCFNKSLYERNFAVRIFVQQELGLYQIRQASPTQQPEGKRPLGRPRRSWEDGIRMDLREIGLGCVDWIRLAQDRDQWRDVVSAVMNLRVLAPSS
jgi:hypothetical protein